VPAEFGTVALALSVLALGGVVFDGGLGASLVRRPTDPTIEELRNVLAVQIAGATALVAIVASIGVWLGEAGGVAALMMLALPAWALRGPGLIMLERRLSFGPIAAVEVGEVLAYYVWAVVAVALGYGVWGVATASIAKALVGTLILFKLEPGGLMRPAVSWERIRSLLGFGVRVQAVELVRVLRDQILNLGTFAVAGAATLGLWALATRVLQLPVMLFEPLWRVSFPAMSQLIAAGENPKPLMERAVAVVSAATAMISTMLVCSAPALVPAVFGARWADAAGAVATACIGLQLSGPISVVAAGYLFASGNASAVLRSLLTQAAVWVAIALPLLPSLGATALGLGCIGAGIAEAMIFSRVAQRSSGARLMRPQVLPLTILLVASTGGWFAVSALEPTILAAAAGALLGAVVYGTVLLALRPAVVTQIVDLGRQALTRKQRGRGQL
jgi:O-antigen/teichoic acid export membrane protein